MSRKYEKFRKNLNKIQKKPNQARCPVNAGTSAPTRRKSLEKRSRKSLKKVKKSRKKPTKSMQGQCTDKKEKSRKSPEKVWKKYGKSPEKSLEKEQNKSRK